MASGNPTEHHAYWSDLMVIGAGMVTLVASIKISTTWLFAAGLVVAITGFASLRRYRWAPLGYFFLGLGLLLGFSIRLNGHGFSSEIAGGLAASLTCILLSLIQLRRRRLQQRAAKEDPVVSLVLLQRAPRFLDDRLLAAVASIAWGVEVSTSDSAGGLFVSGELPTLVLRGGPQNFLVHVSSRPFWDEPERVAARLNDVRAQRVVHEHHGWLSVQLVGRHGAKVQEAALRRIGSLLAELADADTLAIVRPDTGAFHVWDDSVAELLKSPSPLECFTVPNSAPVVPVSPDDPLMAVAVAEARRRWPEFVFAFQGHHPEQHFSVKAPVTRDGQTEHIWIEVASLNAHYVRGSLGNDPVDLTGLKLGDPISVPVAAIEDWLYVLTDTPVGGFTIPVVTSAPWRAQQA